MTFDQSIPSSTTALEHLELAGAGGEDDRASAVPGDRSPDGFAALRGGTGTKRLLVGFDSNVHEGS